MDEFFVRFGLHTILAALLVEAFLNRYRPGPRRRDGTVIGLGSDCKKVNNLRGETFDSFLTEFIKFFEFFCSFLRNDSSPCIFR